MNSKLWTIEKIYGEITHLYDADCNMPTRWAVYKLICKVRDTMQAEVDAAAKREEVLREKLARYIDDEIDHQEFLSPLVKQKELRAYYTELTGRQYGPMSDKPHIPLSGEEEEK